MSTLFQRPLRSLGLALAAASTLGAAAPAQAASLSVSARCEFPKIGPQSVSMNLLYAEGLRAGDSIPPGKVTNLEVPPAVRGLGATVAFVQGSFLETSLKAPVGAPARPLVSLEGVLPSSSREFYAGMYTFGPEGEYTATVTGLRFVGRATDAAGAAIVLAPPIYGAADPAEFAVPCVVEGTPSATFSVGPKADDDRVAPTSPAEVVAANVTSSSASIRWTPSTDDRTLDRYSVRLEDLERQTFVTQGASTLESTFNGLRPSTEYKISVLAFDRQANASEPSEATFRTPPASTTPVRMTPKISNYAVTGGFTIWVEPATQPGEPRRACIEAQPSIAYTASGFDTISGGAKLYFQGLWQTTLGYSLPWPMGLVRSSDDHVTSVRDGANVGDSSVALQLSGQKGGMLVAPRQGLASRGRVTILAWYAVKKRIGWFNLMVPTFLPTKSVPFAFLEKPAGACDANNNQLLLN